MNLPALLPPLRQLVRQAGSAIMTVYASDFAVQAKDDASPVTAADLEAERIIVAGLRALTPDIPVISEEAASLSPPEAVGSGPFWLVDPLDGTKEFVKRNGEFTVNIGLVIDGLPRVGVLYAPAIDRLFAACPGEATSEGPDRTPRPLGCRRPPAGGLVVLSSRSHRDPQRFDDFVNHYTVAEVRQSGSSLKFALIAAGEADLYPRFGPTMEWDTAAGHAILAAAGGCVTLPDGTPLSYGKPGYRNPSVVAWGTAEAHLPPTER
jgi:3'(2'), 5'-bisphosphate nucleotidase